MTTLYMLLITYPNQTKVNLMKDKDENNIVATEQTKQLLINMGEKLLKENVISGFQLAMTVGNAVTHL